jgi:hypothetical protein
MVFGWVFLIGGVAHPHYAPRMSNHRLAVAQSFGIA